MPRQSILFALYLPTLNITEFVIRLSAATIQIQLPIMPEPEGSQQSFETTTSLGLLSNA